MPKTYNDIYLNARRTLRELGIAAYTLEARILCADAAGKSWTDFLKDTRLYVTDDFEQRVAQRIERRETGEPAAYITGSGSFYGLSVIVTPDVLIPRIDTEITAREAIRLAKASPQPARILDLCTGSGCIGLAIAVNVPNSRLVLADQSVAALNVCRRNLLQHNVSARAIPLEADALAPPPRMIGNFDIIVCNPPYIRRADISSLDAEVRDFEPMAALDGGEDGFLFYRKITENWKELIRPGGSLIYECGIGQAADVKSLMEAAGFSDIEIHKDTLEIDRVVIGHIRPQSDASF